jgi:hypothetical protein
MVEYLSGDHIIHRLVTPTNPENESYSEPIDLFSKPRIVIKKDDQGVIINFDKAQADCIRLYSKRSSEDNFSLLTESSGNYYIDTRPNSFNAPELREYMAHYVKNNVQVGQSSDIVLIIKK